MSTIIVKAQAEWDALPAEFSEYTVIEIRSEPFATITVLKVPGSASVEAWESARVVARESARVEAWESARVEAWGSARVVARESARVEAWGSARVEAWAQTTTHHRSSRAPQLHGQAVCFLYDGYGKPILKSDICTVIAVQNKQGVAGWLEAEGIVEVGGFVTLFKRVSAKFQTQENTENETIWSVGATLTHENWNPTYAECGGGKFHACSRPYFCDEFRSDRDDVYVSIRIAVADLHAWKNPKYPHKIAFREGFVISQVDRFGEPVATSEGAVTNPGGTSGEAVTSASSVTRGGQTEDPSEASVNTQPAGTAQ